MRSTEYSRLYLLAADANDVIIEFAKLPQSSGCEYLPGVTSSDSTRRYIKYARKGLRPIGVAFVDTNNNCYGLKKGGREYDHSDVGELENLAGQLPDKSIILFVNTIEDEITAFETNRYELSTILLKVVDGPTITIPDKNHEETVPAITQTS